MVKKNDNDLFELMKQAVQVVFEEKEVITRDDLKYLPTKDEFYEENLKILKRLDDIELQMKMLSSRTYDNTDRIDVLEKLHPKGKHVFAS